MQGHHKVKAFVLDTHCLAAWTELVLPMGWKPFAVMPYSKAQNVNDKFVVLARLWVRGDTPSDGAPDA